MQSDRLEEEEIQAIREGKFDVDVSAKISEQKEAKSQAIVLEIVSSWNLLILLLFSLTISIHTQIGDIPDADIKPPDNVLFVVKLNPVTKDEDLQLIFSRFGECKADIIRV